MISCQLKICLKDSMVDDISRLMERKQISFRLDPGIIKKLKILAIEQDKSMTDLILEAVQDLLKKYGKKKKGNSTF